MMRKFLQSLVFFGLSVLSTVGAYHPDTSDMSNEFPLVSTGMKRGVSSSKIPFVDAPLSPAVKIGNLLFISGQLGRDPSTGKLASTFEDQTKFSLQNIKFLLEEVGGSLNDVYLSDMNNAGPLNDVYSKFFDGAIPPARSAFQVAQLPLGALVEIEAIAVLPASKL